MTASLAESNTWAGGGGVTAFTSRMSASSTQIHSSPFTSKYLSTMAWNICARLPSVCAVRNEWRSSRNNTFSCMCLALQKSRSAGPARGCATTASSTGTDSGGGCAPSVEDFSLTVPVDGVESRFFEEKVGLDAEDDTTLCVLFFGADGEGMKELEPTSLLLALELVGSPKRESSDLALQTSIRPAQGACCFGLATRAASTDELEFPARTHSPLSVSLQLSDSSGSILKVRRMSSQKGMKMPMMSAFK
mmetsp:Transcript_1237/g.2953  ORF Transcript_1237/g.2953 Transcript_1237/m.2953 type:complete len:248 (+) Transcript_1237:1994-2737(+)